MLILKILTILYSIFFFQLQVYPGRDITNIVESSHYQKIGGWCRQGAASAAKCKGAQRWIKPFRCLGKKINIFFCSSSCMPYRNL